MSIDFKEIVLDNYGGMKLKAGVDENPKDIIAAVCYNDHGDDFLVIKTKDNAFRYGLFITRNGYHPELLEDENHYQRKLFVKIPELVGKFDFHSEMANDIYFFLKNQLYKSRWTGFGYNTDTMKNGLRQQDAQHIFDWVYRRLKGFYDDKNVIYHGDNHFRDIRQFLALNDILTKENEEKLEEIKTFLRIDAIDGICGKQEIDPDDAIGGDDICWIYYNGKKITKKYHKYGIKVKRIWFEDDWGGYGFCINLSQFKKGETE